MTLKTKDAVKLNRAETDLIIAKLVGQQNIIQAISVLFILIEEKENLATLSQFVESRPATYSRLHFKKFIDFLKADLAMTTEAIAAPELERVEVVLASDVFTETWSVVCERASDAFDLIQKLAVENPDPRVPNIPKLDEAL